jgi:uncharacterized protein (TIGR00251 family)
MPELAQGSCIVRIAVKVTAGASNSAIGDWREEYLRVRISAAPERGKANAALIALLAKSLGLSKSSIHIIRGQHSAHKTLEVSGLSQADIMSRLHPELEQSDQANRVNKVD